MSEIKDSMAPSDSLLLRSRYNLLNTFYSDILATLAGIPLNLDQPKIVYANTQAKNTTRIWLKNGGEQLLRELIPGDSDPRAEKQITDLQLTDDITVPFSDKKDIPEINQRTISLTDIKKWLDDARAKLPEFQISKQKFLDQERRRLLLLYEDLSQYRELLDRKQIITPESSKAFSETISDHLTKHGAFPLFREFLVAANTQALNGDFITSLNLHPSIMPIASRDESQIPIGNRKTLTFDHLETWVKAQKMISEPE